jgi:hypothetical protein
MRLSRRELIGYAVAGTTGMGITAAARRSREPDTASQEPDTAGVPQHWRLGSVYARPAEIEDTAITFRGSVQSSYDTDYEVAAVLYYRPKTEGGKTEEKEETGDTESWQKIAEGTGPLSEGLYLEATETGLETGTAYEYRAEAYLTNYVGESHRVSEIREVTAGEPCSGPSTNCLRAETLAPEVGESESESGAEVTLRGRAKGLAHYDEVSGRFFYWREDESEQWTDFTLIETGEGTEGDDSDGEFSATLSDLPAGRYTYYAEVRGEGGDPNNMYAEGEEREFSVE